MSEKPKAKDATGDKSKKREECGFLLMTGDRCRYPAGHDKVGTPLERLHGWTGGGRE